MRTIRATTGWAIASHTGAILVPSVQSTRHDAIRYMTWNVTKSWQQLRRQGFRAVKVRITPVKERAQ
jgi:hypothetical protein